MSLPKGAPQAQSPQLELVTREGRDLLAWFDLEWLETLHKVNAIPEARLRLIVPDSKAWQGSVHGAEVAHSQPGTEVTIRLRQDASVLFAGIVVTQECAITPDGASVTLTLRHALYRLVSTFRSQLFEKKSDRDILGDLLAAHGLRLGRAEGLAVLHAQMLQYACSDWQFCKSRLLANGVWLLASATGVDVVKPAVAASAAHTLSAELALPADGIVVEEAAWRYSNAEQPARLEVGSWRRETQALAHTVARPAPLGRQGLDPARLKPLARTAWSVTHSITLAQDEQAAQADASLLMKQLGGIQASFTVWGSTAYAVGQTLRLSGYGAHLDGLGLVTEVRHKISKGSWRSVLMLGGDHWSDVDAPAVPAIAGLHVGVVARHEDDSSGLNRIRVHVPVLRLPAGRSVWARFGMPYASQGAGLCLYPEAGDEVILGFFEGDPRHPVILGSMHNPKNRAPYAPSAANGSKGIVLARDGVAQQLMFDSASASLSIRAGKNIDVQGPEAVVIRGARVELNN